MHPRRLLQLFFSIIRRQRHYHKQHHLNVTSPAPSNKNRFHFLRTSHFLSDIPLTTISECDEDEEEESRLVPDLAMLYSSSRFFFSSPGSSNSIIDQSSSSTTVSSNLLPPLKLARNSVAVHTYSANPHLDFKTSMQELVEASRLVKKDTAATWSFLHDMLLCYLALNHKTTHKYIIRAFADLLVNMVLAHTTSSSGQAFDY